MAKTRIWVARACAIGLLVAPCVVALACVQDAKIAIDRALNSPTLTVKFSGAHVSLVELRVNGASFGTRSIESASTKGETNFTLDLGSLNNGDNEVEVRLYDKNGKLVGTEKSTISADDGTKAPVYLTMPKVGATVQGAVSISVGFGKEMKNTYVSFFIDNRFKSMTNSPPFTFIWDSSRDTNGWHEIEAWVVDESSVTYKTKRVKVFVNNPGGNTARRMTSEQPAAKGAVVPTPKPAVVHPDLQTSLGAIKVDTAGIAAGTKVSTLASVGVAARTSSAVQPRVNTSNPIPNTIQPDLGSAAGTKAVSYSAAVATGPQMLTPTGARMAVPKVTTAAIVAVQKPSISPQSRNTLRLSPLPAVTTADAGTALPSAIPPAPKAQTVTPAAIKVRPAPVPVSSVASASLIRVTNGSKLPHLGSFAILLDAKPVGFDAVKPRVTDGVPLTPFRYLFEQSGGKVGWTNQTKTVNARGHGREIYIKIGDKLAKVNDLPIEMDLAPFIEKGRTVVPLSFLKDTLDVEIDYDPVSGHVLITSIKKKR